MRNENSLSVLLLSRNRPDILQQTLGSLLSGCAMMDQLIQGLNGAPARLSINVRIDEDDDASRKIMADWPLVKWHVGPRPATIGEGYNHIWKCLKADFYLIFSDDKIMATPEWDRIILEHSSEDALGYAPDEDHARGAVTQFVLPHGWAAGAGYLVPEWFPFWFIDTWWDHIAAMIGNKKSLPLTMKQHPNAPETTGMRDLGFWAQFFQKTEQDRIDTAGKIRKALYGNDPEAFALSLRQQEHWLSITRLCPVDLDLAKTIEEKKAGSPPSERYLLARKAAEDHLLRLEAGRRT